MTIYVPLIKYWNCSAIFGNFEGRWFFLNCCSKSQYTITRAKERSSVENLELRKWAVSKQKRRLSSSVLILNVSHADVSFRTLCWGKVKNGFCCPVWSGGQKENFPKGPNLRKIYPIRTQILQFHDVLMSHTSFCQRSLA